MNKFFRIDLQVHPYKGITMWAILRAMERRGLDGVALLYYEWEPRISLEMVKKIDSKTRRDYIIRENEENVISFTNKSGKTFWVILSQEVGAQNQRWHILSIGVIGRIKLTTPEGIIREILARGGLPILDHPFADPQRWFKDISREKERELIALCRQFQGKIALEWNGYCHYLIRKSLRLFGYNDCNKKTERLAKRFSLPLLPTTDLHAKHIRLLKEIGTCYVEIPTNRIDFGHLVASLTENILAFNFRPQRGYVAILHCFEAYGLFFPNLH